MADLTKRMRKILGYVEEAAPYTGAIGGAVAQHFFGLPGGAVAGALHYTTTRYAAGAAARGRGLSGSAVSKVAAKSSMRAGLFTLGGAAATGVIEGIYTGFASGSALTGLARGLGGSVDPLGLGGLVMPAKTAATEKATGGMITSYDQIGLGQPRKTGTLETILNQFPGPKPTSTPPTRNPQPPGSPQNTGGGAYGLPFPIPGEREQKPEHETNWGLMAALGLGAVYLFTRSY